jgi:hypothetical protein
VSRRTFFAFAFLFAWFGLDGARTPLTTGQAVLCSVAGAAILLLLFFPRAARNEACLHSECRERDWYSVYYKTNPQLQ